MAVATKAQVDAVFKVGVGGTSRDSKTFVLDVEKTLNLNMLNAMERLGFRLVDALDRNAPESSGGLKSSFKFDQVRETKTGYRIEISVGKDYADYVDKGVRGVDHQLKNKKTLPNRDGKFYQFETYFMPAKALMELEGWMRRKNMEIEATNLINRNDEGRTMLPQISSSAKRMAYYIKKYGIAASNYQGKSIEEVTPDFNIDIREIGMNSITLKVSK